VKYDGHRRLAPIADLALGNIEKMSAPDDSELFSVLKEMRSLYPDWRFGQMVCNVTVWAHGPDKSSIWDIEDAEFIRAARAHIANKSSERG
jgi:hypothetical protein